LQSTNDPIELLGGMAASAVNSITEKGAMQTTLKMLGTCFLLVLGIGAHSAHAQYPSRSIKIVVPTTPGAVTDILARVIGQGLSQSWSQPVVVDNRPGADEMLGVEAVPSRRPTATRCFSPRTPRTRRIRSSSRRCAMTR
jgi:tripartite-type tricarboxylate transporter receptor subunit TctC